MADGSIKIDTKLLTDEFKKDFGLIKKSLATLTASATAFGIASINTGKKFERAMSQVGATMGLTVEEIKSGTGAFADLTKAAREAGKNTEWSASEAAEALNYMALAGYNAEKSIKTLPTVLNLASAGALDLARASDMITDAMSALGLNTENVGDFADVLVKASQKANASVGEFGEAILTIGATGRILKGGVIELTSALGVLANAGYKGAQGGTVLRNVILSLTAPTSMASKEMERLGINAFDSAGNMRNLQDILNDFNIELSKFTEAEREDILNKIFNRREIGAVKLLLANINTEFNNLQGNLIKAKGTASETAKVMKTNLTGALKGLKSKFEDLSITFYNTAGPAITKVVEKFSEFISKLADSKEMKNFSDSIVVLIESLKELAEKIIPMAITVFNSFANILGFIGKYFNEIIIAFGSYKIGLLAVSTATKIAVGGMTAVWTAFNAFFMSTVVGAIIVGLVYLGKKIVETKELLSNAFSGDGLKGKIDNITKGMTTQKKELAKLTAQYELLKTQIKNYTLFGRFFNKGFNVEEAKKNLQQLEEKITKLKEEINSKKGENGTKKQTDELVEGMSNFQKKVKEAKNDLDKLNNIKFSDLETELSNAEEKLKDFKTQLTIKYGEFNPFKFNKSELEKYRALTDELDKLKVKTDEINEKFIYLFEKENIKLGEEDIKNGLSEITNGFEELGEAIVDGSAGFGILAKAGLNAISSLLNALAEQIMAEAVSAMMKGDYGTFGTGMAKASAIKIASGVVKANAGRFENGGIIGGSSYSGDKLTANVNSGELILNIAQQDNIAKMLMSKANSQPMVNIQVINNTNSQVGVQQDELNNIKIIIDSEINQYMTGSKGEKMMSSNYGIRKVGIR